jgi:hypothetical protein
MDEPSELTNRGPRARLPKAHLQAVFDDDLQEFLESLGLWGKLQRGDLRCKFSGTTITVENLHSLFPQSGRIQLVCDAPDCIRRLTELLNEGEVSI